MNGAKDQSIVTFFIHEGLKYIESILKLLMTVEEAAIAEWSWRLSMSFECPRFASQIRPTKLINI